MKIVIAALLMLSMLGIARAGDVTLTYQAPTACENNAPISNCPLTGFEVSEGSSQTGTFTIKELVAPTVLSRTYVNLAPGTKCYFVKAISNTAKSAESTRVCADIPSLPPKAPQGLTVTVKVEVTVATP